MTGYSIEICTVCTLFRAVSDFFDSAAPTGRRTYTHGGQGPALGGVNLVYCYVFDQITIVT